ncbi:hypothetical protein [Streptomyces albus]|uniref:hypothetical protein n=1 Tax=Streptomyces albus TaxID=1888 RepID=UPI0033F45CE3
MLTAARHGSPCTAVRVVPDSPCAVVSVAFDRGYLDDPPHRPGLAHLFEHVWFALEPRGPALEWGETGEHAVVLHHTCPPDQIAAVVDAVATRLARLTAPPSPEAVTAALRLIRLEHRGLREEPLPGFPRRPLAGLLRGDPGFDPVAVRAGARELPALAGELGRFAHGRAHAVCVAGPTPGPAPDDLARMCAGAGVRPAVRPPAVPPAVGRTVTEAGAGACAAAWVLPRTPQSAAAARLVAGLLERRPRPAGTRWVSGTVLSPHGVVPVRGGHLYAVAAGTDGRRPCAASLPGTVLLPLLRGPLDDLATVRSALVRERPDVTDLAAWDALDLLHGTPGRACGPDDVRRAVRSLDAEALHRFTDLLAAGPYAEIDTLAAGHP